MSARALVLPLVLAAFVAACGGDRREAARRLGVSYTTLWRILRGRP